MCGAFIARENWLASAFNQRLHMANKSGQLFRTIRQIVSRFAEIDCPRPFEDRPVFLRQALKRPLGCNVLRRNSACTCAEPDTGKSQHHSQFVTLPIRFFVPLCNGVGKCFCKILLGDGLEQLGSRRSQQTNTVSPGLGQQDCQIGIQYGRFESAGLQFFPKPFAELEFTPRRISPRHDIVLSDDCYLKRAAGYIRVRPCRD